jgi:hypothetical protein
MKKGKGNSKNKGPVKRRLKMAKARESELGPLSLLPGKWKGVGTGWNMIALPFDQGPFKFRLLMNQYDETLEFSLIDDNVPNRGLPGVIENSAEEDQFVVTLDYQQSISQQVAEDFPTSGLAGDPGLPIHHEPGLWLYMKNLRTTDKDITGDAVIEVARLANIPHGNSVLALGTSAVQKGEPDIPPLSGLPIGRFEDLDSTGYDVLTDNGDGNPDPYLEPYKHYIENPFMGNVSDPGFPGFNPKDMNEILRFANQNVKIDKTTILDVDTTRQDAGVANIPFVVKQAEAVSMKSTFWIQELKEKDENGHRKLRLQYSQIVMLDFFRPREDGHPGRARWPHISINTLEKVSEPSE